jgi:molybdate transport system substrate-binding protein
VLKIALRAIFNTLQFEQGESMSKFRLLFLLLVLWLAACAPQASSAPTPAPKPATLTVMAAASLTAPFKELGKQFEAQNPTLKVEFNFAGSQQLAQQLANAAPADVFASASQKYIDAAVSAKRTDSATVKNFASNRLVIIVPAGNPAGLKQPVDLSRPGLKLILAAKAVPVGQYALDFLDKAAQDPAFGSGYRDQVLKNVVSYEDNVKAVLTKIQLGEADAGIVYTTDAAGDPAAKVVQIPIPDSLNVIAVYPLAPISDSPNRAQAQAFIDLVLSPPGQAVLAKYGFLPPEK